MLQLLFGVGNFIRITKPQVVIDHIYLPPGLDQIMGSLAGTKIVMYRHI